MEWPQLSQVPRSVATDSEVKNLFKKEEFLEISASSRFFIGLPLEPLEADQIFIDHHRGFNYKSAYYFRVQCVVAFV